MSVPNPKPVISIRTAPRRILIFDVMTVYTMTPAKAIMVSKLSMNSRYFSMFFISFTIIYGCVETGGNPFPTHTLLTFHPIYCKNRAKLFTWSEKLQKFPT